MGTIVLFACVFFFGAVFGGPVVERLVGAALDRHRRARRELNRCGGVLRTHPTSAPRFDRDPSPRARASR